MEESNSLVVTDERDIKILELEAKLSAIGRSQLVIEFDMSGGILWANNNFLKSFGYTLNEVVGRHHGLFVDAETLASVSYREFWDRLRAGEYTSQEYKRLGKNGDEIWIRASYNPILNPEGQPFKVIKYASDVTQSKLLNADCSGQISAIDKSQAVVEFDLNGIILSANTNFLNAVGYELAELKGKHHSMLVEPETVRTQQYEAFWSNLRLGNYHAGEYRRRSKDGKAVWLQASYNPILDLNGRPFKIVKYATDMTNIVEQKEAVRKLEAQARASAEAAVAAKTDFLANMSHELRTPLTSVLGFSGLLGRRGDLNDTDRRYVDLIRSAGQTLLTVVNDVLDFSKLEAGAVTLELEPLSVRDLVSEATELLQEAAETKGLSLTHSVANDAILKADPVRLRQILLNLVGNAVKFTAKGSVSVTAETSHLPDGRLMLDVRVIDTGPGIKPDQIPVLFERFTQADASVTRRFGGTGLGLAISQNLVTLMGGQIGAVSDGSTGSTFWIRVPCPAAAGVALTAVEAMTTTTGPNRALRILLAEDHPANQLLVSALLAPFDVMLDIVENGREAVKAVQGKTYDLVFMDMQMPVMDGVSATRRIRRLPEPTNAVPIIALTANVLPEQIALCKAAGMQEHMTKPIDLNAMVAVLKRYGSRLDRDSADQIAATG